MKEDFNFKNWLSGNFSGEGIFKVNPYESALIIVDVQYAHAHPDYGLGAILKGENKKFNEYFFNRIKNMVIPNIKELLQFFRKNNLNIIYITFCSEHKNCKDMSKRIANMFEKLYGEEKPFYPKGNFINNIIEDIKPDENDIVINKLTGGAFASSNIDFVLRNMGMKTLFFTGVSTDMCVERTLREASDRDYNCIIIEDACATFDQESHDEAIRGISRGAGLSKKTQEVIKDFPWKCYEL